jgi:hypothetical protein
VPRLPHRVDKFKLAVSFLVAAGLVLIVSGFLASRTGREAQGLPDEIEIVNPGRGDRVLRQTPLTVNLADGYQGVLIVDGIELPVQEIEPVNPADPGAVVNSGITDVRFDPGSNTLTFQPQEGALIERFEEGQHTVTVVFWKQTESRERSFSYTWSFQVI